MTREQFDLLVQRIEQRFAGHSRALRLRIALLLTLGLAVFASWFAALLVVSVLFLLSGAAVNSALGYWLLALGVVLLVLGLIQVAGLLLVEVEPIRGRTLDLREAPALESLLARLGKAAGAVRFDQVIITTEFNAGVVLQPRLGVLGLSRRVLRLGLPLLEAASPPQVEAVLAHEFYHLSARHGRFGTWIYWQRQTWERLFPQLQEPAKNFAGRIGRKLLRKFIDWFWPRFNAYAFVLSRADEYAADRFSAEWAGAVAAASALWTIECQSHRVNEEFWEAQARLATTQPQPPADLIDRFRAVLDHPPTAADAARWMQQAAARLTDNLDTHPSFAARVKAIGCSPGGNSDGCFPLLPHPSAAEVLLEGPLGQIRAEISTLWQAQLAPTWRQRYNRSQSLQQRLASAGQPAADDAGPEVLWEQARATWDVGGDEAAEPLLRRLVERYPSHSAANLALGKILVDRGRNEGEAFLQRILEKEDDDLTRQACEILASYYRGSGLTDRLQEVRRCLGRYEAASAAAMQERSAVSASDRFIAHDLSPEELAALREVLGRYRDLKAAYLARKELEHFPRQRLFVLCVRSRASLWSHGSDRDVTLASVLVSQVRLPGRVLVIAPRHGFRALGRRVMRMPGAMVFPASDSRSGDEHSVSADVSPRLSGEGPGVRAENSPRPLGEGQGVRARELPSNQENRL